VFRQVDLSNEISAMSSALGQLKALAEPFGLDAFGKVGRSDSST
jgi:hypothetical protein